MAKIIKTINLPQPALLVAKMATLQENAGTTRPDHPLFMLPTTHKDTRDARYPLQGIITASHPTD